MTNELINEIAAAVAKKDLEHHMTLSSVPCFYCDRPLLWPDTEVLFMNTTDTNITAHPLCSDCAYLPGIGNLCKNKVLR